MMYRNGKHGNASPGILHRCGSVALAAIVAISGRVTAAPLKVMPLGDSVTLGYPFENNGGYRGQLWRRFGSSSANIDIVGSLTGGSPSVLSDRNHEGHSGFTIAKEAGVAYGGLTENMAAWLKPSVNPDIILLMIGTNDVNFNYRADTAAQRLDHLISVISNPITGVKPLAKLIVASVLPIDDSKSQYRPKPGDFSRNARAIAYNAAIPGIVAAHRAAGENVFFFDMYSRVTFADLTDGLHPTVAGYNKLGDAWYDAIQSVPEPGGLVLLGGTAALLRARTRSRDAAASRAR